MDIETLYGDWLKMHQEQSRGERLRRLKLVEKQGYAEKVFWTQVWHPAMGDSDNLIPEFEVADFKDGRRFLDFAYLKEHFRVCFEIDGYGPHWRNAGRTAFSDERMRQNHLVIDGWKVIRFSFDDVKEKPRQCQQVIQQLFGRWLSLSANDLNDLSVLEKEAIRMAARNGGQLKPVQLYPCLGIGRKRVEKLLRDLVQKGWLIPDSGTKRICRYRVAELRKVTF